MDIPEIQYLDLWKEITDTYTQLAISALILPIIFLRQILGVKPGQSIKSQINSILIFSWATLSICILLGIAHQLAATREISDILLDQKFKLFGLLETPDPRIIFKWFIGFFYLGVISFAIGAVVSYLKEK